MLEKFITEVKCMKNTIVLFLMVSMVLMVSCSTSGPNGSDKPVSGQIPSTDKTVLEGTPLNGKAISEMSSTDTRSAVKAGEYNALDRLYDTVWFQTESEYDDGVLEEETEFLFFKNIGGTVRLEEREMENGVMEKPDGDNEYETLTVLDDIIDSENLNAFVAKNTEYENGVVDNDEPEWEGYWLKDAKTLYVIDGKSSEAVTADLKAMILPGANLSQYDDDRYLLSEKSDIVEIVPIK